MKEAVKKKKWKRKSTRCSICGSKLIKGETGLSCPKAGDKMHKKVYKKTAKKEGTDVALVANGTSRSPSGKSYHDELWGFLDDCRAIYQAKHGSVLRLRNFASQKHEEIFSEPPPAVAAQYSWELIKQRVSTHLQKEWYKETGKTPPSGFAQDYEAAKDWNPKAFTRDTRILCQNFQLTLEQEDEEMSTKKAKAKVKTAAKTKVNVEKQVQTPPVEETPIPSPTEEPEVKAKAKPKTEAKPKPKMKPKYKERPEGTISGSDAAAKVLGKARKSLNYKVIVECAIEKGWTTKNKSPVSTMYAILAKDSRFVRTGRGLFGLKK